MRTYSRVALFLDGDEGALVEVCGEVVPLDQAVRLRAVGRTELAVDEVAWLEAHEDDAARLGDT